MSKISRKLTKLPQNATASLAPTPLAKHNLPSSFTTLLTQPVFLNAIAELSKRDEDNVFAEPVDPAFAPNYAAVVSTPMDLATMKQKADALEYTSMREFADDFNCMCANAMRFNPPYVALRYVSLRDNRGNKLHLGVCGSFTRFESGVPRGSGDSVRCISQDFTYRVLLSFVSSSLYCRCVQFLSAFRLFGLGHRKACSLYPPPSF